jgi:ribosomal protein S18 acetylase RimI-like enzyme
MLYAVAASGGASACSDDSGPADTATPGRQQHQQHHQQQQQRQHPRAMTVVGYIVVQVNSLSCHVNKLAVAPGSRRRGLGSRLLQVRGCVVCCWGRDAPPHRRALTNATAAAAAADAQAALRVAVAERRVQCATLHVDTGNAAALALYSKAGFGQVCFGCGVDLLAVSRRWLHSCGDVRSSSSVACGQKCLSSLLPPPLHRAGRAAGRLLSARV